MLSTQAWSSEIWNLNNARHRCIALLYEHLQLLSSLNAHHADTPLLLKPNGQLMVRQARPFASLSG
jgi:hypothetical protein